MLFDNKRWTMPETKPLEPWRRVLIDAAGHIRTRGWCQFSAEDENGSVCAGGAISLAASNSPTKWGDVPLFEEACERVRLYLGYNVGYAFPSGWNNEPERTADDVINALEGAARS